MDHALKIFRRDKAMGPHWCTCRVVAAGVMAAGMVAALPALEAFPANGGASGGRAPLILPFHIGKPIGGPGASPKSTNSITVAPQGGAWGHKSEFNMMGWPWVKPLKAASQPSQQQINADLQDVLKGMNTSARLLKSANAGIKTQGVQKSIIARLNELIKIAEQSQGKSSGQQKQKSQQQQSMSMQQSQGSNTPPMTPSQAAKSSYIPGGGVMNPGDLKSFNSNKRQWGNLPPRERNMILNALRHQTLPQYKSLVQQYYESLAKLNK